MKYKFLEREVDIPNVHLGIPDDADLNAVHFGQERMSVIALVVAKSLALECPLCKAKFNGREPSRAIAATELATSPLVPALESIVRNLDSEAMANPVHASEFLVSSMRDPLYPDIVSYSYVCPSCQEVFVISQMDCYSGRGVVMGDKYPWFDVLRDLQATVTDDVVRSKFNYRKDNPRVGVPSTIATTPYHLWRRWLAPHYKSYLKKDFDRFDSGAHETVVLDKTTVDELVVVPIGWFKQNKSVPVWAKLKTGEITVGYVNLGLPTVTVGGPKLTPDVPKTFPVAVELTNGERIIQTGQVLSSSIARGTAHTLGGISTHTGNGMRFGESLVRTRRQGRVAISAGSLLNTLAFALDSRTLLKRMTWSSVAGKEDWLDMSFITGDKDTRSYLDPKLQQSYLYVHNSFDKSIAELMVHNDTSSSNSTISAMNTMPVLNSILYTYGPQNDYEEAKKNYEDSNYMLQRAISALDC